VREYLGNFEVHLTTKLESALEADRFTQWCQLFHLKCVRIILDRGEFADQPMATWRRGQTTLSHVRQEAHRFAESASREGFAVTRLKIEADPHNADLPKFDEDCAEHNASNYFEHHVKLQRPRGAEKQQLLAICELNNAHVSRNAFRDTSDFEERFVTLRGYHVGLVTTMAQLQQLLDDLHNLGETILEHESEYCLYDTNLQLDAGWLPNSKN
jgi:hypothetical protein